MTSFVRPGRRIAGVPLGMALLFAACLGGCAGGNGQADGAKTPALEKRDVELEHEDCDLDSSSAKAIDANSDGRPDLVSVFSGGREICRAADINMDTVVDVFIYYDDAGRERRRESGFDRDTRPDEIGYYEGGVLVRKERETNNDAKIDTWSYYEGGKLVREERDSTGDGYVDQWWTYANPDCAKVVSDGDGDGKPEADSEIEICRQGVKKPAPAAAPGPDADEPTKQDGDDASEAGGPKGEDSAYEGDEGEPSTPSGTSSEGEESQR